MIRSVFLRLDGTVVAEITATDLARALEAAVADLPAVGLEAVELTGGVVLARADGRRWELTADGAQVVAAAVPPPGASSADMDEMVA